MPPVLHTSATDAVVLAADGVVKQCHFASKNNVIKMLLGVRTSHIAKQQRSHPHKALCVQQFLMEKRYSSSYRDAL
jgi:hypothetical protein